MLSFICESERVGYLREVEDAFERHYDSNKHDLLDLEGVMRVLKSIEHQQSKVPSNSDQQEERTVPGKVSAPKATETMEFYSYSSPVDKHSLLTNKISDTPLGIEDLEAPALRESVEAQAANLFADGDAFGLDFYDSDFLGNQNNNSNTNSLFPREQTATVNLEKASTAIEEETTANNNVDNNVNNNIVDQSSLLQSSCEQENEDNGDDGEKTKTTTQMKNQSTGEENSSNNNIIEQITPKQKHNVKERNKHDDNNHKNSIKVSPEQKDLDPKSADEVNSSDESEVAPKTRKSNKTKYVCKDGCQNIVSTDIPSYCDAPHCLRKRVCHGCGTFITRAVMKATGTIYYCSMLGHFDKGVLSCSYVMCGTCHLEKEETEGKQRRRTRGH